MRAPSTNAPWPRAVEQNVEDPSANSLAVFGQRDDHPERRLACGEVVGAVERVDDPAQRIAEPVHDRGVGMRRFLSDDHRLGQNARQACGEDGLGLVIRDGDDVVGGLGLDLAGGELLIMRPDRASAHEPQQ
jgi:hypothetical protein